MHRGGAVPGREIEVQAHGETGNAPGQSRGLCSAIGVHYEGCARHQPGPIRVKDTCVDVRVRAEIVGVDDDLHSTAHARRTD